MKALPLFFVLLSTTLFSRWEEERQFFEENGYVWIKDFFSEEQVKLIQNWTDEINVAAQNILTMAVGAGQSPQYFLKYIPSLLIVVPEAKNGTQVCRTEDMLSCYPALYSFISGTVTAYISNLLQDPYVLFKDKINFKWPGGGAFLPHQDFPAYDFFGPREHITAMITIDAATTENGCLQVAKQWRQTFANDPTLPQDGHAILPYIEGGAGHGSIQPEYASRIEWLKLETSPRDLVLFNSYLPHYSEPNHSKSPRRAMFLTHNRLKEGDHRSAYYYVKRNDPENPAFHFATPTKARNK